MKRNISEFPPITARIWEIVTRETGGNVSAFVAGMGGRVDANKIHRLFVQDKRNGKYPEPTISTIKAISESYPSYSLSWIANGVEEEHGRTVNNISVTSNKTSGNSNVIGNGNNVETDGNVSALIETVQRQQAYIEKLLNLIPAK